MRTKWGCNKWLTDKQGAWGREQGALLPWLEFAPAITDIQKGIT
ncbi:MAG TPA: hypothetical protein VFG10_08715 [Saprospiraceae bacterium]|nr:hypothetical protein [Saprospiraceae bacterium]